MTLVTHHGACHCGTCGVKSFYVPRSHPDGYSVNARCIDGNTVQALVITPYNGKNWEAAAADLHAQTEE